MQFEKLHSFITGKLEKELHKYQNDHNVHNTREVLHNARQSTQAENIW